MISKAISLRTLDYYTDQRTQADRLLPLIGIVGFNPSPLSSFASTKSRRLPRQVGR